MDGGVTKTRTVSLHALVDLVVKGLFNSPRDLPKDINRKVDDQYEIAIKLFNELLKQVSLGNKVQVKSFGSFSLRELLPHVRNPSTGEVLKTTQTKRLKFTQTQSAINEINN